MKFLTLFLGSISFIPDTVNAQELNSGDTAWMLTATSLVLFMTLPGLALFYGGLVRSRNVLSLLMQCFTIACISSIVWVIYGYSIAFKGNGNFIGDLSALFLSGITRNSQIEQFPETVFIMFQMTFAIITPALVVGAFAERMKFGAMCIFSLLWLTFVYLPACHMVWGGGILAKSGVIDFAGGLVVHVTCGIGALVAAVFLGPRRGFPNPSILPHNRTMVFIGAAMLWFGWFGFNAGSALTANYDAGMAMLVTHISATVGAFTWITIEWIKQGKPTIVGIATGMVAGLAAITPAAGTVGPQGAILIGLTAGLVCFFSTQLLKGYFSIDDSLDVFPIHGVGGIVGSLLLCFLGNNDGFLGTGASGLSEVAEGSPISQLIIQTKGIMIIGIWTAIATFSILKLINIFTSLRVNREEELEGLDEVLHGETGYNL
ncbi:MAG: ammonium transporter [Woeseiaceae bacterium]|tara:strand:- start:848 stop:2140 length:1293 start_codon:yes stop_codon:yes gene_type:complete